jgi:opacity protein-like surface antigen
MKRYLLVLAFSVAAFPAYAADVPLKAPKKFLEPLTAAAAGSGLYVGINGGMAFTGQQYDFVTLPGLAEVASGGTGKLYPAGGMAGLTLGFGGPIGSAYAAIENDFDYDFTQASTSCMVGRCSSKNSWFLAQKVVFGAPLPTIAGVIPNKAGLTPPSQWPIPIAVPTNFTMSSIMPAVVAGIAEHNISACATLDGTNLSCGNRWVSGLLLGVQLRFAVAQGWSMKAEYDYVFFRHSFTPTAALPLFVGQYKQLNEQVLRIGVDYHL